MPVMPSSTCSSEKTSSKEVPVKAEDKFPECESCINRVYDPEMCEDCIDACNYEPGDEEDDFFEDDSEEMTLQEFKDFWKNAA